MRWREPRSNPVTIGFVGDLMPGAIDGGGRAAAAEVLDLLRSCRLVMANLETPLTGADSHKAEGSSLWSPPSSGKVLGDLNISVVSLANNHIMDRGQAGLEDTLRELAGRGIAWLGAGPDIRAASQPFVWRGPGLEMVFLAASYEAPDATSTADVSAAGANPLRSGELLEAIRAWKDRGRLVCVTYHGGDQFFRVPCPKRRELFRDLAGSGADLVIGHHAHVFQGIDVVGPSVLAFGLGNFAMDTPFQNAHRGTAVGLLLLAELDRVGLLGYSTRFIYHDRKGRRLELVSGEAEHALCDLLEESSRPLRNDREARSEWRRDCGRELMNLNTARPMSPARRLFQAARSAWGARRASSAGPPSSPVGDGWRYACSKRRRNRDALLGMPLWLGAPGRLTACYRAYNEAEGMGKGR